MKAVKHLDFDIKDISDFLYRHPIATELYKIELLSIEDTPQIEEFAKFLFIEESKPSVLTNANFAELTSNKVDFITQLSKKNQLYLIVRNKQTNDIIGYLRLNPKISADKNRNIDIEALFVKCSERGKGIATHLIDATKELAFVFNSGIRLINSHDTTMPVLQELLDTKRIDHQNETLLKSYQLHLKKPYFERFGLQSKDPSGFVYQMTKEEVRKDRESLHDRKISRRNSI